MPRNPSDQFVKFVLEIEPKERHGAIDEDDLRNERQDVREQQARPSEGADEWRQQQHGWELERHREEADGTSVRALEDGNGATLVDRVGQNQAGGLRREVMKRVEDRFPRRLR
jgi:hypothetical protein